MPGFDLRDAAARLPAWPHLFASLAAFLIPALALWLPSGYSWGAALLLIAAIGSAPHWLRMPHQRTTLHLALTFSAMGLVWLLLSDPSEGAGFWDRPIKFLLALPCLLFAAHFSAKPRALWLGLIVGSLGAGSIALWQVFGQGLWRANGTTNAIQYGNLSLLLATMLAVLSISATGFLRQHGKPWLSGLAVLLAVAAGFMGSILSLSRGGWLALAFALPFLVWLMRKRTRLLMWVGGLFLVVLGAVALSKPAMMVERWDRTFSEIVHFDQQGGDASSIGQRLEHWRFAWNMGLEKPVLGWSLPHYVKEKTARVAAGDYRESILEYKHAHNEVLDVFAKAGLLGVVVLGLFYGVPLYTFWSGRHIRNSSDPALQALLEQERALQLAGVSLVLLFIGFGFTQVFFAHNSGIMSYLFLNILLWSCLCNTRSAIAAQQGTGQGG